jgi:hypothetical protein
LTSWKDFRTPESGLQKPPKLNPDAELCAFIEKYQSDPLGFVKYAYPWGEVGTPLEQHKGPDQWQCDILNELGEEIKARKFNGLIPVAPIRETVASGHGIGKSTLVAWLVNFILSTRPLSVGTITANTVSQLETKTWPAIDRWTKLCITSRWFTVNASSVRSRRRPRQWCATAQTCREENSEAFQGQHASESTSFYIFDEASAISDKIFEAAEGGLTDGEPMIFLFGNPTRSTGKFYRATFGSEKERWKTRSIDSRTSSFTNKQQIAEWIQDYGEDSDFVRVRVRGLPPRASELQYIDQDRVWGAQKRQTYSLAGEALVAGVDVSGGGAAWNVVRFRQGNDSRSIPPIRIPGEQTRDRTVMVTMLSEVLRTKEIDAMFIDSAFGSPIVERLRMLGHRNVHEVNFGARSPDANQENMRAYMWTQMKDWLLRGAIDPKDTKLELDMCGPGYHLNKSNRLVIESKESMAKRGVASPDDGDALALTFAEAVRPKGVSTRPAEILRGPSQYTENGWME